MNKEEFKKNYVVPQNLVDNMKIVGNIVEKDGTVCNFKFNGNYCKINSKNKTIKRIKIPLNYFLLKEEIFLSQLSKYLLKSSKGEIKEVHSVPIKFLFEDQKTTDGIIRGKNLKGEDVIVLIQRLYPPIGLAMPGGMVEGDETFKINFIKEMLEELNLKVSTKNVTDLGIIKTEEVRGSLETNLFLVNTNSILIKVSKDEEQNKYFLDENENKILMKDFLQNDQINSELKEMYKTGELQFVEAGDDAVDLKIIPINELDFSAIDKSRIIPHHGEILKDFFEDLDRKKKNEIKKDNSYPTN